MNDTSNTESPRKFPLRMPPDWEPPYPSFESDLGDAASVSMAVVGCQFEPGHQRHTALECAQALAALAREEQADHVDLSEVDIDSTGHAQIFATIYWLDAQGMHAFFNSARFKALWTRNSAGESGMGLFREQFNAPAKRFETLHSGPDHLVGVAHARQAVSGPLATHAYWGSMRDRIAESSHDPLIADTDIQVDTLGERHVQVTINHNFAVIRSGQDLRDAEGTEYTEYFRDVEPALRAGMAFLRDHGEEVNCKDCRYASLLSADGSPEQHTFGLAFFKSLDQLEAWAQKHPTHLAIFNAFLEFAPRYGAAMKSRYWHEVSVLPFEGQFAEYINCAPGTGLMPAEAT